MNIETIFLFSVLFFIVIVAFFYLLRVFMRLRSENKRPEQKDRSQVGFVVDTFHELVSKLKEKERELEELRKIAEQKADDVESYNRNVLQSVPSGVISFDSDLRIKSINTSAEKILGLRSGDAIGKSYNAILGVPISDIISERKLIERGETQYQTSDGRRIWLGLTFSPLRDSLGKEIGNILVFTDLTELKTLESQAELRRRLSSLGEISAGIAHELRNPLGVIAGYTKLLSKKAGSDLLPTINSISKEVDVMDRIISDFLSFAKPVELTVAKINLNEMIENCISSILGENNKIEVSLDIDKSAYVLGDEVLLRQACTNLIQNSVEAMKDGGKLSLGYKNMGDFVEVTVSDTGHGIPESIKDKIFLPFYTTKEKGTGLGLAIVQKIIVSHGGEISVESSNEWTTFKVRLPLSKF